MVEIRRPLGHGPLGPAPLCTACGTPLGRLDAAVGDHCRTLACRAAMAVRRDRAAKIARDERDAASARAVFAGRPGIEATLHLPAFDRPLLPHDPARAATFRATLTAAMAEAVALATEAGPEPEASAPGSGRPELEQGCALCGGSCCRFGGDHAFLAAPHLARRLGPDPATAAGPTIEAYMARLPALSYAESCLFHGPAGCALDRHERSDICNAYRCAGLGRLADLLDRGRRVGASAVAEGVATRSAVIAPAHLSAAPPPV